MKKIALFIAHLILVFAASTSLANGSGTVFSVPGSGDNESAETE